MSINSYRNVIILMVFISMSLTACKDRGSEIESISSKEDDIREAVFRYQFGHNESGQQQNTNIYFLCVMTELDSNGS
jgi:hypothetical protein